MPERMLNPVSHADVSLEIKDPVDETALGQAKAIIAELRSNANGPVDASKLLEVAKRLGDLPADHSGSYAVSAEDCKAAFESLDDVSRNSLVNIHSRVKVFAEAQLSERLCQQTTAVDASKHIQWNGARSLLRFRCHVRAC